MLALDPSSSCTGYAVLEGLLPGELLEGGLLKPSDSKYVWAGSAEASLSDVSAWLGSGELAAYRRVIETLEDVRELVERVKPDRVVLEVPSGKVGTGARRGARGSLTTYGMAAGAVWSVCRELAPGIGAAVIPVTERQWTKDAGSKAKRVALVKSVYGRRYDASADDGMDTADAIGLGRWYWRRCFEGGVVSRRLAE